MSFRRKQATERLATGRLGDWDSLTRPKVDFGEEYAAERALNAGKLKIDRDF
jgi:hypothetical protein